MISPSLKNLPVGPSLGSVATKTILFAPSLTDRPPKSAKISWVAVSPGVTAFTKMLSFFKSAAAFSVKAFSAALEML